MGESYFGKISVGGSELVKRLRAGGDVETATADKVRAFIRHYRKHGQAPEEALARMRRKQRIQYVTAEG